MAFFKCKMCGGTVEFEPGATVGVCDSCGTKQTLPRLDDDKKANLYDRANHFRRNNDYDKAMSIYEQILNEDNTDAESYWSILLCRYGIEYVEDPATHKHLPTINRAQYTSVFDDEDYKSALRYADAYQREIYEAEAQQINEIQKGILAISQQEEPFDVFICYKETDANGRRTQDSVLATELYHELAKDGFKVFFSRITLEDKLGIAYEPYIFAALNSAKVMVVLGTRPENFNAVWVKNEWSRYLALIRNGARKVLIPAYRDMDPYDLPEEFSHLQAQDMSKLGFMQDLTRGIKKILAADVPKTAAKESILIPSAIGGNFQALLERGFMALEDSEWDKADGFFEDVLNQDAKCAEAYLGKLMAELKVKKQESLKDCAEPFYDNSIYQKILRFANVELCETLNGYIEFIVQRNAKLKEEKEKEDRYQKAISDYSTDDIERVKSAKDSFVLLNTWNDSKSYVSLCEEKIVDITERNKQKQILEAKRKEDRNKEIKKYKRIILSCTLAVIVFFSIFIPVKTSKNNKMVPEITANLVNKHFYGEWYVEGKKGTWKFNFSDNGLGERPSYDPHYFGNFTLDYKWEVKANAFGFRVEINYKHDGKYGEEVYPFKIVLDSNNNPIAIKDSDTTCKSVEN